MDHQDPKKPPKPLPPELLAHYNESREAGRLESGSSLLELARTQEVLQRHLPPPPGLILDVGGGTGPYALWLAKQGYEVHLIDAVPLHIDQARRAAQAQPDHPLGRPRAAREHPGKRPRRGT